MERIRSINNGGFNYQYQGNQSSDTLQTLLTNYLSQHGYQMHTYRYDPSICDPHDEFCNWIKLEELLHKELDPSIKIPNNAGMPLWILVGENDKKVEVFGIISDKTYANLKGNFEFTIPSGKAVLDITFDTSNCVACENLPTAEMQILE